MSLSPLIRKKNIREAYKVYKKRMTLGGKKMNKFVDFHGGNIEAIVNWYPDLRMCGQNHQRGAYDPALVVRQGKVSGLCEGESG